MTSNKSLNLSCNFKSNQKELREQVARSLSPFSTLMQAADPEPVSGQTGRITSTKLNVKISLLETRIRLIFFSSSVALLVEVASDLTVV